MGEIATWSAVKTKVGLGKTGNDCPTKAELLALTPTGTGESYVGLEISNASSYGNNECVKPQGLVMGWLLNPNLVKPWNSPLPRQQHLRVGLKHFQ